MTSVRVTMTTPLQAHDDVVARAVGDEMVLLDLQTGIYYTLNSVGATVWRGIEDALTATEILDRVVAEYDVDVATARADIDYILGELVQQSLLIVK